MAYKLTSNGVLVGLTSDTKPTNANYPSGTRLIEQATDYTSYTTYINNGTVWTPESDLPMGVYEFPSKNRHGCFIGSVGSTTPRVDSWEGILSQQATGSATYQSAIISSAGLRGRWVTGTTANS